jgi:hypothetical protein
VSRSKPQRPAEQAGPEAKAGLALDREPCGTIDMAFRSPDDIAHVDSPIWQDISCLAVAGLSIFCSCDETSSVERVTYDPKTGRAEEHESFALGDAFDLPEGRAGEMDIEGIAISDGHLWVCGSHSLKRDKPKDDDLAEMEEIDWDANRGFLGRVPLLDRGEGSFTPVVRHDAMDGEPERAARMMEMKRDRDKAPLRRMLAKDPLIGPFIDLPCKENGFDVEGLAVRGNEVLLGLRGPVLRGLALLVRMEMKVTGDGWLKPRKLEDGRRYSLHAIDLNGQGIRDLAWQGDRLLILSGATTDLEALQSVFALPDFRPDRLVYPLEEVGRVLDLPIIRGADHAEGIALTGEKGAERLIVTYDSPHADRTDADAHELRADVFEIASTA